MKMAASQKRSRKTKLVPRECTDFAVDKYLLLQEHIQPLLRQIPEQGLSQTQSNADIQPLLRQTIPGHREDPESFLKFNVQVEVEEYKEENKVEIVNNSEHTKPARTTMLCGKDRKTNNVLGKEVATKSKLIAERKQSLLCVERESEELEMDIVNESLEDNIREKSALLPCESNEENKVEMVTDEEVTNPTRTMIYSQDKETGNELEKEISPNSDSDSEAKLTSLLCLEKEFDELPMEIVNNSIEDTIGKKSTTLLCETDREIVTEIGNVPESSTKVTETVNDSESSAEETEIGNDPESSTEETEIGNDPESNTEPTEIGNDPESSTDATEIGNDPESIIEVVEIVDDPDSSTEATETVNDLEINTKPAITLLCVKDGKTRSELRDETNDYFGKTIKKHVNAYLRKEPTMLTFNELEKKIAYERKKNTTLTCAVDRETIKQAVNEISKKTTNIADKIIEIEVKNLLGKKLDIVQLGYHDELIQKALQAWRMWYYQSKLRECIVSYKCYICNLAWWHLTPFRNHIRTHEEPKIGLETVLRECHLICYSNDASKRRRDIAISGNCWRCLKSFKKHSYKYRKDDMCFQCEGCHNSFFPCWNLVKHEAICQRYHKIIFKNTIRHESDWKCNICDLNLLTKERFESHLSGYHSVRSDVPLPTPLQKKCFSCDQEYHLFNSHICLKKNCNFQCTNCFRRFQTNWFVEFHLRMSKHNFDCRVCHKTLKTQCMEMEHMLKHTDNYVHAYRCLFCEDYVLFSNLDAFRLHVDCAPCHVKRSGTKLIRNYCEIVIVPKSCMTKQSPKIVRLEPSKEDSIQKIAEKRKMLQNNTPEKRKKPNSESLLKRPDLTKDKNHQKSQQDEQNSESEIIIQSDHRDSDSDVELVNTDDDDVQVITDDDEHVQLDTGDKSRDETVQVKEENIDIPLSSVFQPSQSVLKKVNDDNRSIKSKAYEQEDKFTYEKMLAKVLQTSGNIPETFTFSTEISDDDFEDDIIVLNKNLIKDSNLGDIEMVKSIEASNLVPDEMVSSNLVPDENVSSNLVPDENVSSNLVPDDMLVSSNLIPDDMVSSHLVPDDMVSSNLVPDDMVSSNLLPDDMVSSNLIPDEMVSSNLIPDEMVSSNLIPDEMVSSNLELNYTVTSKLSTHKSNKKRQPIKNNLKSKVANSDLNKATSNTELNETKTSNSVPNETDKRKTNLEPNLNPIRIKQEPIEDSEYNTQEQELNIDVIKTEITDDINDTNIEETNETQEDNKNIVETSSREETETLLDVKREEDSYYSHGSLELDEEELRFTEISLIRKIVGADGGGRNPDGHIHVEAVTRRKNYSCTRCGFHAHHAEYKNHIKNCCPRQKYNQKNKTKSIWTKIKCTKCDETFIKLKNYIAHFSKHAIPYSTCPQCFQRTSIPSSLGPHLLKHVRTSFTKAHYIHKDSVSRHVYQCNVCKQRGILFRDLLQHWEKHLDVKTIEKVVEYKLEESDEDFAITAALPTEAVKKLTDLLQLPTATYNSGKRVIANDVRLCSLCDKVFGRRTDCKRHLIEHLLVDALANKHKYSGLRCQICKQISARADTYRKHMRDHGLLPIYTCELCNKSFSDSSNFAKHKKVHNLMCLICDTCHKKFQSKTQLIKHIEYHNTTEPIRCEECGRVSYSVSMHKKHMKLHTKEVSARCPTCRRHFDTLKLKWEHMWLKHGERNVQADCPVCNMPFRTLQMLKAHLKDDHDLAASFTDIIDGIRHKKRIKTKPAATTSKFQLRDTIVFETL